MVIERRVAAPMCRLDHRYFYDLTAEAVDGLIEERRGGTAPAAPAAPGPAGRSRRAPGGRARKEAGAG